jgi:hypothetical protein
MKYNTTLLKKIAHTSLALLFPIFSHYAQDSSFLEYKAKPELQKNKKIVLIAGDDEYRSEETMPMLAKILSQYHGFDCDVLFSVAADGLVDPIAYESLTHPESLDQADLIILCTRFRIWNETILQKFAAALDRATPIIALRTSTHAFHKIPASSPYEQWNWNHSSGGFGKKYLGESWLSHWGVHKGQSCKALPESTQLQHPILKDVLPIFTASDVYEAAPPNDATILMRGEVLSTMSPFSPPAQDLKKRKSDNLEQPVNSPMMPICWTREISSNNGKTQRIVTCTMGAATDFMDPSLRRLILNSAYWSLQLNPPTPFVSDPKEFFSPTFFGFKTFIKGKKPADYK